MTSSRRIALPVALLLILMSGSLAYLIYYGSAFPPRMAVHFNSAGEPNGWMDRLMFIVLGASMTFMLPPFLVAALGVMPRVVPARWYNIPNREYWDAPERRDILLSNMLYFALWLGCLVEALLVAVNVLIAEANPPVGTPHLTPWHAGVVVAFLIGMAVWVWKFMRAFEKSR